MFAEPPGLRPRTPCIGTSVHSKTALVRNDYRHSNLKWRENITLEPGKSRMEACYSKLILLMKKSDLTRNSSSGLLLFITLISREFTSLWTKRKVKGFFEVQCSLKSYVSNRAPWGPPNNDTFLGCWCTMTSFIRNSYSFKGRASHVFIMAFVTVSLYAMTQ